MTDIPLLEYSSEQNYKNSFTIVPYEMIRHILLFLEVPDLCRSLLVSKEWYYVGTKDNLWREVFIHREAYFSNNFTLSYHVTKLNMRIKNKLRVELLDIINTKYFSSDCMFRPVLEKGYLVKKFVRFKTPDIIHEVDIYSKFIDLINRHYDKYRFRKVSLRRYSKYQDKSMMCLYFCCCFLVPCYGTYVMNMMFSSVFSEHLDNKFSSISEKEKVKGYMHAFVFALFFVSIFVTLCGFFPGILFNVCLFCIFYFCGNMFLKTIMLCRKDTWDCENNFVMWGEQCGTVITNLLYIPCCFLCRGNKKLDVNILAIYCYLPIFIFMVCTFPLKLLGIDVREKLLFLVFTFLLLIQ